MTIAPTLTKNEHKKLIIDSLILAIKLSAILFRRRNVVNQSIRIQHIHNNACQRYRRRMLAHAKLFNDDQTPCEWYCVTQSDELD